MKRLLLLFILVPACAFAQKKDSKAVEPTPAQMDSTLTAIYNSYDAERQILANQIQQATDTTFLKALSFQVSALETKCAERMWGYVLMQNPSDYTLQLMYRFRSTVSDEIVEKSLAKIKDKSLTQSDVYSALKYYVANGYVKLGDTYRNIELNAVGTLTSALDLSKEVNSKNILLILGDNEGDAIPATFKKFYERMDHSSIDVVQVKFFKNEAVAAEKLAENKEIWPVFADYSGMYSKTILNYNVSVTPLCLLIEKSSGKIIYESVGLTDDIMGQLITM